jgi:hypothetical protein
MEFVQRIADTCQGVAIFDTHISLWEWDSFEWRGRAYWGRSVKEHAPEASTADVEASLWYSLDNRRAFKFTRDSLCNLLRHVGFTSVFECLVPYEAYYADGTNKDGNLHELKDRITLIGVKGERRPQLTSPLTDSQPEFDRLERSKVDGFLERSGRRVGEVLDRLLHLSHRKIACVGGLRGMTHPTWRKPQD